MPIINHNIAESRIKNFIRDAPNTQGYKNINAKQKELFLFFKKDSLKIENTRNGPCKYFGQYNAFKKQGYGLYITQNGEEWLGNWHKGKKEGDFIGKVKSGDIYHYICHNGIITSTNIIYKKPNLNSSNRLRNGQIANQETNQRPQHAIQVPAFIITNRQSGQILLTNNKDLENKAVDLFIKEVNNGRKLTKNTAININNPKIIAFIKKQRNKEKKIQIIADILKISKCKNDGKEIFNYLKDLAIISPYRTAEEDIKKLFAILHKDSKIKYSKTFNEFFKIYCQEESYSKGCFVLNEILKLNRDILKSLEPEDVIKSLYVLSEYIYVNKLFDINQDLQNIFFKNIGKICLFKKNQPYFIENKEELGSIKLDIAKIHNDKDIERKLRKRVLLEDDGYLKNQLSINLLLFFNKNPIDFTIDEESKRSLVYLVLNNIKKEIMPSKHIKRDSPGFFELNKHLTDSDELFQKTQKEIAKYKSPSYQNNQDSQSASRIQNDSEEIRALENQCKDSTGAGKKIFDFIKKQINIPSDTSGDDYDKENYLKVYKALAVKKDDIINLLKNTQKEDLKEFCLKLFNISMGSAGDGCVANVGTQINEFVTNEAIKNAPESIKTLNFILTEILHNFNQEYQIGDILGGEADSDIYGKKVYKDFLINQELLIKRIEEKLNIGTCNKILKDKFFKCFIEGEITTEEQKNLALATILIELKEKEIDLTKNYLGYDELENLYNVKMAKEEELALKEKEETAPKHNPTILELKSVTILTTDHSNSMYQ